MVITHFESGCPPRDTSGPHIAFTCTDIGEISSSIRLFADDTNIFETFDQCLLQERRKRLKLLVVLSPRLGCL